MSEQVKKVGFIGAGAMAEALLTGFIKSGLLTAANVSVSDINSARLSYLKDKLGVGIAADNHQLIQQSDVVFLAVKPYVVQGVLTSCQADFTEQKLLVSIAAGVTIGQLEKWSGNRGIPVVRVMPNTPALVGESASALARGSAAGEKDEQFVLGLLQTIGKAVVLPESLLDAVTGLSGSGPAFVYLIIEALADAGVMVGLPRDVAYVLSAQTLLGSAKMVLETGKHPGVLKDQVTTPGGTTIAGMHELEAGALRSTLQKAVVAATQRAHELSNS